MGGGKSGTGRCCASNGLRLRGLCCSGKELAGDPTRYAEPDSEGAADVRRSHPVYDGSSDPRQTAAGFSWYGLPVATRLRGK
jgi:hypothetical protein